MSIGRYKSMKGLTSVCGPALIFALLLGGWILTGSNVVAGDHMKRIVGGVGMRVVGNKLR